MFDDMEATTASKIFGLAGQDLVSNVEEYRRLKHLEGLCPYQWRSGVKHDCLFHYGALAQRRIGVSQ